MIAIINYGSGNVRAVGNIYDNLRIQYEIISTPDNLNSFDRIILPGVGSFDETVKALNQSGFRSALDQAVLTEKKPVLGICVGMQILAEGSEEGKLEGLAWVSGYVKKFNKNLIINKPKTPHLGWNSINPKQEHEILDGIDEDRGFYFIHSYYFQCTKSTNILATTTYGIEFASAVISDNIIGTQFHPEKSHSNGVRLLKNFATL
jgi:imidazole glycerol-phosphate synthase subunit HisH